MRRLACLMILPALLAACSDDVSEAEAARAVEVGEQMLDCAIGPGSEYSQSCTLQTFQREEGTVYRVNHPGGGFRLFNTAEDGSGLVPHDGAEGAVNKLDGDVLEVAVGEDRYRFPAKANAQ